MLPKTDNYLSLPYQNSELSNFNRNNYYNYSTENSENFHKNNRLANSLINNRLDKLNYEKQIINKMNNRYQPPNTPHYHNYSNLASFGHNLIYPNYISYDMYLPLYNQVVPRRCSPVPSPTYIEGGPLKEGSHCSCHRGNTMDLLLLLMQIKRLPRFKKIKKEKKPPTPKIVKKKTPPKIVIKNEDIFKKVAVKGNVKKPGKRTNRNWWKLIRDFTNMYLFFGTAYKYSTTYKKMRAEAIEERTKTILEDANILKEWIILIEEPFWNEFKIFEELNVAFKNSDPKNKIKKQSQKIIAIIKKFMENLIKRSSKLSDIPAKVQKIIYGFIKERAYFPKKYLSTYQINRIDFEFYGGVRDMSFSQAGMIISYFLICGICVQQILLHMKDVFLEFTTFPYIDISGKYIGSIMHYLTRDAFVKEPGLVKNIFALFNYYRNYHIYNEQVEKYHDIFSGNLMLQDTENEDEYSEYLVNENDISEFFNLNPKFVETFKSFIHAWSSKLSKSLKTKYDKEFPNPLPRKKLEKPAIKRIEKPEDFE